MTARQERIVDQIASLGNDPRRWDAGELSMFQTVQSLAVDDREQRGRRTERKAEAKAQRGPRREFLTWSEDAGYAAVDVRSRGRCEHPDGCDQRAEVHHHKAGRGGNDPHDPDNLLHLCNDHHLYVHAHPKFSYANGSMVRRNGRVS